MKNDENKQAAATIDTICDDPDFLKLCKSVSVFNPFDVLGLETYELRHTKTLAWLLDPKGSHNLQTAFLRLFLEGLSGHLGVALPENLDAALVFSELPVKNDVLRLDDVSEPDSGKNSNKSRIDVYLQIGSSFFLAIEAKIGASEHGEQLANYRRAVEKRAAAQPSSTKALLYLTLDGAAPEDQNEAGCWTSIKWSDHVIVPLRKIFTLIEEQETAGDLAPNIVHFISDYLHTLEKVTGSPNYGPRVLAKQILRQNDFEGPVGTMINIFHGNEPDAKGRLRLRLKSIKGGPEASKLLLGTEAECRAKLCSTIASELFHEKWVRLKSTDTTRIDFITEKMCKLMGRKNPPFFFRLDFRKSKEIELKLFFEKPVGESSQDQMTALQKALVKWPEHAEWSRYGDVLKDTDWCLGKLIRTSKTGKDVIGQKMATITFGKASGIIRTMPADGEITKVNDWLAKIVPFVDRRIDEILNSTGDHSHREAARIAA